MTLDEGWCASHRFARISARKVRPLMTLLRGRRCDEALELLRFNGRRASGFVRQVVKSAMSNADEQEADMRRLVIVEARVDDGPSAARWRPKDRGRAHPIRKRTSHIIVRIAEG